MSQPKQMHGLMSQHIQTNKQTNKRITVTNTLTHKCTDASLSHDTSLESLATHRHPKPRTQNAEHKTLSLEITKSPVSNKHLLKEGCPFPYRREIEELLRTDTLKPQP